MRRRMERMVEEIGDGKQRKWSLAIDLIERDDKFVLRAVPGIKPEDVRIEVDDDLICKLLRLRSNPTSI